MDLSESKSIEDLEEYARDMAEVGVRIVEWDTNDIVAVFERLHRAEKSRTVTTITELNALLPTTVVRSHGGTVYEKQVDGPWHDGPHDWQSFEGMYWDIDTITLPATVLYEPGVSDDD